MVVNLVLFIIDFVTSPGSYWFWWVTVFWGAGLIIYAFNVFVVGDKYFSEEWEEKKTKEIMEEEKKNEK